MEIGCTNENLTESIEGYFHQNHNVSNLPKVIRDLQSRIWALKFSGCQVVSFRSVMNFFRRKFFKRKSAKELGYHHFYTDEERRLIFEVINQRYDSIDLY